MFDVLFKYGVGFMVLLGNFFDSVIMKMLVVGDVFCWIYFFELGVENMFEVCVIVFDGFEDYYVCIDDFVLDIDECCILVICGCGMVGYLGSLEVVNMVLFVELVKCGVMLLLCMGDGCQSGMLVSLLILNMLLEVVVGGGFVLLCMNDCVCVDLNCCSVDVFVDEDEFV